MALNDLSLNAQGTFTIYRCNLTSFLFSAFDTAAVDVYPGVANPTQSNAHGDPMSSNFVRLL